MSKIYLGGNISLGAKLILNRIPGIVLTPSSMLYYWSSIVNGNLEGYASTSADVSGGAVYLNNDISSGDLDIRTAGGINGWNAGIFRIAETSLTGKNSIHLQFIKSTTEGLSTASAVYIVAVPTSFFNYELTRTGAGVPYIDGTDAFTGSDYTYSGEDIEWFFSTQGYLRNYTYDSSGTISLNCSGKSGTWTIMVGIGPEYVGLEYSAFEASMKIVSLSVE